MLFSRLVLLCLFSILNYLTQSLTNAGAGEPEVGTGLVF